MGEELSMDNIMEPGEIENLFTNDYSEDTEDTSSPEENEEQEENTGTTENYSIDDSESVGSGVDITEELEDTDSFDGEGTSPNNFYSSIAKALKDEGVFPDLDEAIYSEIKTPDDFKDLIEYHIQNRLDSTSQRINYALGVGVEPTDIQKYERTLQFINNISEDAITDESSQGENLRKNLIFQDYINRGYSRERAEREVQKSLNAGSDIEDARESLQSNREFYSYQYNNLMEQSRQEAEEYDNYLTQQAYMFKQSILEDNNLYGDFEVDSNTRKRVYSNIAEPRYTDTRTGEAVTELQRYEREHKEDFIRNVGLLFTLTNGFKNMDGILTRKVRKEMNKGLRNLENMLSGTSRTSNGNLKYVTSLSEDSETFLGKGWKVDV